MLYITAQRLSMHLPGEKMVRLAGLEPANRLSQSFRLRGFRCHSLHMDIRECRNEIKQYLAFMGNCWQDVVCKICANLRLVQTVCKDGGPLGTAKHGLLLVG